MKKTVSKLLLLITATSMFAFSSPAPTIAAAKKYKKENLPEWVSKPYSLYNEKKVLAAAGSGPDDSSAEAQAKSELARSLIQTIDSKTTLKSTATMYDEQVSIDDDISVTAGIKNLTGIQIAEKYYTADGRVYALAILDRQEACNNYSKIIKQNDTQIIEYIGWAETHPGDIQSAVYGQKALKLAADNDYYIEVIRLIQPPYGSDTSISYGSYIQLYNDVTEIKKKISVKVIVEGDVKGMAEASVKKVFEKIGVTCTDSDLDHTYLAVVGLELQKADSPDEKHFFCNYVYTVEIVNKNNKDYFTYSAYGRAGHLNEQGAKHKAMLLVTKDIESKFLEKLTYYAENGSQQ